MRNLFNTVFFGLFFVSCGGTTPHKKQDAAKEPEIFPLKLTYCQIPKAIVPVRLENDYIWLIQDAEDEASVVAVERGENSSKKSSRFVIRRLKLESSTTKLTTSVTGESFGISSNSGAMSLNSASAPMSVDLASNSGNLDKFEQYEYSGSLDCWKFTGQMPY
jgi:hypothetical protein